MSLRYERKFLIPNHSKETAETIVRRQPTHFVRLFPSRQVNSIYFDTPALTHYHLAAAGIAVRTKVRARWYGTLVGRVAHPTIEIKQKQGLLGSKARLPCHGFTMKHGITGEDLARLLPRGAEARTHRLLFSGLRPVILVSYLRSYWQSADQRFRVTIDSDLEYRPVVLYRSAFDSVVEDRPLVLEIKYPREFDSGAADVTTPLPFRMTAFSKYGRGIERTYDVSP